MANTISKHYRESQKPSVPEDSVPLVGLPLEDAEAESGSINDDEERKNDQSQAPIKASPGSKTLSSIFQAKDAHETTVGNPYMYSAGLSTITFCTNYTFFALIIVMVTFTDFAPSIVILHIHTTNLRRRPPLPLHR